MGLRVVFFLVKPKHSAWALVAMGSFFSLGIPHAGEAAPDFKIRYNPKFPCLEVMDGRAVKITDISEGSKGETVTSGKATLKISFLKNASGQPEVTMTEAKSALSEMELEAFGLSVGMKPEGVVTVRFGADNKPQFEMDRTGGARFLMADLGNLDTAAGKETVAALPSAGSTEPSKALGRYRARLAAWKEGKGGGSNKAGKILEKGGGETIQIGTAPSRPLLTAEAVQVAATVRAGSLPMIFQSGAGVFHEALPGTVLQFSGLEAGSSDIGLELSEGCVTTLVSAPLAVPRASLIRLGDGLVARTQDALYVVRKEPAGTCTLQVFSGQVVLAEMAGGVEKATLRAGDKLVFPGGSGTQRIAGDSPEAVSLKNFSKKISRVIFMDLSLDGFAYCPEAGEEIFQAVRAQRPDLMADFARRALEIRPGQISQIRLWSGLATLPPPAQNQAQAFLQAAEEWLKTQSGSTAQAGRVLEVEGTAMANGRNLKVGDVIAPGTALVTGPNSSLAFVASAGIISQMKADSRGLLVETRSQFDREAVVSSFARLKAEVGDFRLAIANGSGEKIKAEIETPKGVVRSQSTPRSPGEPQT